MVKSFLTCLILLSVIVGKARELPRYKSLDAGNPIVFGGDFIVYRGDTVKLGPNAIFVDGQFTETEAAKYPFVYNSVNKAVEHLKDGSAQSPMVLYLAPYVYWIDNPDDPAVRVGQNGSAPYGMILKCEWLKFYGLSDKPENVVLACNRGQTIGSQGNFTMFKISGQGTSSENVTFGNYCNIDLEFPLKPELNRGKRASAIVQAQLIHCDGDHVLAINTRFVSRLNLCPFWGAKRVLFDRCHFESTDDALCGTGVYLNCTLDFYGSKPFYNTTGTGAVMLNCNIRSFSHSDQFFTKAGGQVAVLDSRLTSETSTYMGWRDHPPVETKNYQYAVSFNGKFVLIGSKDPQSTVEMEGKELLNAYRFMVDGKVIYNIYNLLSGNDGWDPTGMEPTVRAAEKAQGIQLTGLPVQLRITPSRANIETGKNEVRLTAKVMRFGNCEQNGIPVKWFVAPESGAYVTLKPNKDGSACDLVPVNNSDEPVQVVVTATTVSGLEAACSINVSPARLEPPVFASLPVIEENRKLGLLSVKYKLEMHYTDQSQITWYRCTDAQGRNPLAVAVSRSNHPLFDYKLTPGDAGYFIKVSVASKNQRSDAGEPVSFVTEQKISARMIKMGEREMDTDFANFPTFNQPKISQGFWTLKALEPFFTERMIAANKDQDAWTYGVGVDGSADAVGFYQTQNASLLYTPVGKHFGDMTVTLNVAPSKYEGQGFSVANRYMDLLIKFDTEHGTGYALRLIRTTKFHDAIDCVFVRYEKGKVSEISQSVSTTCFRPDCKITVEVKGNKLTAHASSQANYFEVPDRPQVVKEVNMMTEVVPSEFGGFGIQYAGGAPTMIKNLKVKWDQ
ncbi:MAG: hypothetical protein WCP08_09935 [Prolixibacteraceae bacterium]